MKGISTSPKLQEDSVKSNRTEKGCHKYISENLKCQAVGVCRHSTGNRGTEEFFSGKLGKLNERSTLF